VRLPASGGSTSSAISAFLSITNLYISTTKAQKLKALIYTLSPLFMVKFSLLERVEINYLIEFIQFIIILILVFFT
jgi:hypothetical protein